MLKAIIRSLTTGRELDIIQGTDGYLMGHCIDNTLLSNPGHDFEISFYHQGKWVCTRRIIEGQVQAA